MKEKLLKGFSDATVFKVVYLMLAFISFNGLFARQFYLTWIAYAVTAFGAITLLIRVVVFKKYIHAKGIFFLVAFCASYVLSALLTRQYGLGENIKALIWMAFQYFVLYAYDTTSDTKKEHREFEIISHVFMVYTLYCAVAGVVMLFAGYWSYVPIEDTAVIMGFLWNRLWGVYTDPNYGAVFAVITIIMSLYFYKGSQKSVKAFYIINIVFQVLYISYSDSRTGLVSLFVALFAYVYLTQLRSKRWAKMKLFVRGATCVLLSCLVVLSSFAVIKAVSLSTSEFKKWQYEYNLEKNKDKPDKHNEDTKKLEVGRQSDDINGDVSNRRFAIWKSGFEIFKTKPLTGVTFRNYIPYAEQNLPKTYIVHNDFGKFPSMHNSFVDIMASQGILGIVIIAGFIILIVVTIFKKFFKMKGEEFKYNSLLLCILLSILVSMMFYSETFYMNTAGAFMFWLVLGYLMQSLSKKTITTGENNE